MPEPSDHREDPSCVAAALARLEVSPPPGFIAFHERYRGPFFSDRTTLELLDMCEGGPLEPVDPYPSIVEMTEICREVHGIRHQYLAISTYAANAVLMYDTTTDLVYDVDFEGGHELLRGGHLEPRWPSHRDLLREFFATPEPGPGGA